MDASRVHVKSQGIDTDVNIPYYTLYWNGGTDLVYCKSGTTCDGNYGSHGARAFTWYKCNTYQNRVHVIQYKFTKTSGWGASRDASAK